MEDLQATVEIAVDLGRLCNVDLFQRGFYQVAVKLLEPSYPHAKAEVHMIKPDDSDHFCPSRVLSDGLGAVSKSLQVLYKREECQLNHTFLFRVHCLLDSQRIMECLKKINFSLDISLHFSNSDDLPNDLTNCMEEVSKKTLKLELDLMYGLYASTMVLFDYGYMAAVEVMIHASLVALHQPLMTMPGVLPTTKTSNIEPSTLESILFRPLPGMSVGQADDFNVRMSNAISVHAKLLKILLTVYANMQNYYITLLKSLPKMCQEVHVLSNVQQVSSRLYSREFHPDLCSLVIGPVDVTKRLSEMTAQLQKMRTLEEIVSQVNMNLASTCSLLLGLWSHVLESSCRNKHVRKELGYNYHKSRVQRFQNSFFTTNNPRHAPFDDNRCGVYNWLASDIRSSKYFSEVPVLPIHNNEADGTPESLPIIFEDIYSHQCKKEPIFRPKSAPSIFSRSSASSQGTSIEQGNGYIEVCEEIGREDAGAQSSSSSISSCGEASETMDMNASKEENTTTKRRKYSGIFRKRKGSYKIRSQRLSVSDDESTKMTLAEFLSSIDDPKPTTATGSKSSSTSSQKSNKTKQPSVSKHPKLKETQSANEGTTGKVKRRKKRRLSQHRRSFDDGAQKLMQRIGVKKRNSVEIDLVSKESSKPMPRSYSSSALHTTKPSSRGSSQSSLELSCDIMMRRSSDDATLRGSFSDGIQPMVAGFTSASSRRVENRFRAFLRSETSEEPESGISDKPVAMSAVNPLIAPITVTTSSIPQVSITVSTSADSTMKKRNLTHHGIVKSQSYSVGIEKLQSKTDYEYPRPHDNCTHHLSNGVHDKLKTSHTTLGGLDRVRYGMGLHPGVGTVTTTDLTPFDEPEPLEAWGEISSSSPSTSGILNDQKSVSVDDVSTLAMESTFVDLQQHDDTLIAADVTPTDMEGTNFEDKSISNGYDYLNEKCDLNEFLKSSQATLPDLCAVDRILRNEQCEEPGSFFFDHSEEDSYLQGSTLPDNSIFGKSPRSQSLVVFTGSLNCSEEPPDAEFVQELEALTETRKLHRNVVFEPESAFGNTPVKKVVNNANSSNASTVNVNSSTANISKVNVRMSTRSKLNQLVGDINLRDVEAALTTSVDIFNAIPPLRQQREKNHFLEKKKLFTRLQFPGSLYTDSPPSMPFSPYLTQRLSMSRAFSNDSEDHHLVVCVHGLDGNSNDLRLVKTYLQLGVPPTTNLSFLMSRANQEDTYGDIDTMTERLVTEIMHFIDNNFTSGRQPSRISFIGHSLGCLLIRSTIAHERMSHLTSRFHTFLSFSGPHLGTIFNNSALVNTGLWLIQKWKKSACLLQLACKDHADLRKTYVYKLSKKKGLEYFRNILLIASAADRYVPYHSARIEMCKQAFRDKTLGPPYQEMLSNILKPVLNKSKLNFVRYHIVHSLPNTNANTVIGRAAHIAVLDSEVFLEKFFLVAGLQYFM